MKIYFQGEYTKLYRPVGAYTDEGVLCGTACRTHWSIRQDGKTYRVYAMADSGDLYILARLGKGRNAKLAVRYLRDTVDMLADSGSGKTDVRYHDTTTPLDRMGRPEHGTVTVDADWTGLLPL